MALSDDDLVARLSGARGWERVEIAVALGRSEGVAGPDALRSLLAERGRGSSDVRCAALLALGRRCGSDATADFGGALSSTAAVRDYAVMCLAAWGRDGFWHPVHEALARFLRTPRPAEPSLFVALVTYLARCADEDPDRTGQLAGLIEARPDCLAPDDADWLRRHWGAPDGLHSRTPDVRGMQAEWLSHPLFQNSGDQDGQL